MEGLSIQQALDKIKQIFNTAPAPAPVEPAPAALEAEYKLADGTVVMIDKLEVGGVPLVGDQPLPDGVHQLEDGTSITVEAGVISLVSAKVEEDLNKQFAEQLSALKADFDTHKNAFTQIQSDFAAARETITKQDEAINGLLKVVEQLASTAVAQPAQAPAAFEKDFESMTPLERFRATK